MTKEEIKNKISMALKDPILQQGFEIICKENAELKEQIGDVIECFTSSSIGDDFEMAQAGKEIYELFYGGKDPKEVFHNAEVPKCSRQLLAEAKDLIRNIYAICKDNHYPNTSVLMEQAEQFLKE